MSGLEQAALAFDAIDAGSFPAPKQESRSTPNLDMNDLFGDMGVLEVDEDSPSRGGGDGEPVKGERRAKAKRPDPDEDDEVELDPEDLEGEDDDADPDADADADDEGEEDGNEDDELAGQMFEVIVDGEPVEVNLREALNGYIRQETFHRRMNSLNEAEGVLSQHAGKLMEDRRKAMSMIDDLQKLTDELVPKEPDWDAEYAKNPAAARQLQKQYDQIKAVKAGLQGERDKIAKQQQADDDEAFLNYRRGENVKLMQAFPHWGGKDGEQRMIADVQMMHDFLSSTGFTKDEIKTIYDSRMVRVAMKAARYDKLMAKRIKPVPTNKGNTKPLNSGAGRNTRTAPTGNRKAQEQLRKTGSVDAAASVFTDIINRSPRKKRNG